LRSPERSKDDGTYPSRVFGLNIPFLPFDQAAPAGNQLAVGHWCRAKISYLIENMILFELAKLGANLDASFHF
jgi:hypothetical protein